jgi:hypothetical protein
MKMSLALSLWRYPAGGVAASTGAGGGGATAGQPTGLLLALTKAS